MPISNKSGRRYDREFKENAVARWNRGVNLGQSLREPKTLAAETPEQRELRRLRQENDYLRRQRDILKKAVGILSAEMPPNNSH